MVPAGEAALASGQIDAYTLDLEGDIYVVTLTEAGVRYSGEGLTEQEAYDEAWARLLAGPVPSGGLDVSMRWQGEWSSSITYVRGDVVSRSGSLFIALDMTMGDEPEDSPTIWTQIEAGSQALDSDLVAIAALSPVDNDFIQRKSGAWTNRTPTQVMTDLDGVTVSGVQTITGAKTFSGAIAVPAPSANAHATTKVYVDTALAGKVNITDAVTLTGTQTISGAKTFTATTTSFGATGTAGQVFITSQDVARQALVVRSAASATANIFEAQTSAGVAGWAIGPAAVILYLSGNRFVHATGAATNTFVGRDAGNLTLTGGINTALGQLALTALTSGTSNTAVGNSALAGNTTGTSAVAVGANALLVGTAVTSCVAVGASALQNCTTIAITAVGARALRDLTTGGANTALGYQAGMLITTANNNTAVGYGALGANLTGTSNTAVGTSALANNTAASNTAVGSAALTANTTGVQNTAVGRNALNANLTTNNNTAFGYNALTLCTSSSNTAVGSASLDALTTGDFNTALGLNSGGALITGIQNVAVGAQALLGSTDGDSCVAVGYQALRNSIADDNTGIGTNAGFNITTGNHNICVGSSSAQNLTTGISNTIIGGSAYYSPSGGTANALTTGTYNVGVGYRPGFGSSTQRDRTVAIGSFALVDGNNAIAIGYEANAGAAGAVAIGRDSANASASTTTADEIRLGTTLHVVRIVGAIHTSARNASTVAERIQAAASPTADLTQWQDSTGAVLSRVTATGQFQFGTAPLAVDNTVVHLAGAETITGVKTFSVSPAVPDASWTIAKTSGLQAALDAKAADSTVVHLAGAETITGVKTFSVSPVVPDASWTIAKTSGLQAALDLKANDASVVHLTGAETITGPKTIVPAATSGNPLIVRGLASQTGNLTEWQDSGSTVGFAIGPTAAVMFLSATRVLHATGAASNLFLGSNAGNLTLTGTNNTAIGQNAGNAITTATHNTFLGAIAGRFLTTGTQNVAIGRGALSGTGATASAGNVMVGYQSGLSATGSFNVFIGSNTGSDPGNTASDNVFIGENAGNANTTGTANVFIGKRAGLTYNTTESNQFICGDTAAPINNVYFGRGRQAAAPSAYTINGTGGPPGTADVAAGALQLAGGRGTGSGSGGFIALLTAAPGTAGATTLNALAEHVRLTATGLLGVGTNAPGSKVDILATASFAAAGVSGITQRAHTVTLTGADPTTYATFYAAQLGAMTLAGTNANQNVTLAAGLHVAPPIKGTNVNLTDGIGLYVPATAIGAATRGYGLHVAAPTGATSNYAGVFSGGYVGIGITTPTALLHARAAAAADVVGLFQGAASQTGDLLKAQDSAAVDLLRVTAAGHVYIRGGRPWADVRSFGAVGDGTPTGGTNDRVAIQAAINAIETLGGGIVFLPQGTYSVNMVEHPVDTAYKCALYLPSNVILRGAGKGATKIILRSNEPFTNVSTSVITNKNLNVGNEGIVVEDLTVDGNAINQVTSNTTHNGIFFVRTTGTRFNRVRCINVRGTSSAGDVNETCALWVQFSSDVVFTDCEADRTDGGSTSVGLGAQTSFGVRFIGCTVRNMSVSHGFGTNASHDISFVGCLAIKNQLQGFNLELGERVTLTDCHAGGRNTGTNAATASYPYTFGEDLGNNGSGFNFNGVVGGVLANCTASYNDGGVNVTGASTTLRVVGGNFSNNRLGINIQGEVPRGAVEVATETIVTGNTDFNFVHSATNGIGTFNSHGVADLSGIVTGVAFINPYPWDVTIYLSGGTVSDVLLQGSSVGIRDTYVLEAGTTMRIDYTVVPLIRTVW